jgi:hypothetical protein
MLGSPEGATIAWVHFLAFDLFVGRWIYLDARNRELPWWATSPLLFLTLMLGPIGLLAYLLVRARTALRADGPRARGPPPRARPRTRATRNPGPRRAAASG